jgi:peptidoglycan-N-acetylglucosamine deacetylase
VNDPRVALTFDAEHPSRAPNDPNGLVRILEALEAADARATFFVQGRWASSDPRAAAALARAGHLVGNHSHFHAPMPLLSAEGFDEDVREAQERIGDACGVDPRPWFRCPFGRGEGDPSVEERLRGLGYRNVGWTVDSGDWTPGGSSEAAAAAVLAGVGGASGPSVVLFHTWPAATPDAVSTVLGTLARDGARFVTVDEVLA